MTKRNFEKRCVCVWIKLHTKCSSLHGSIFAQAQYVLAFLTPKASFVEHFVISSQTLAEINCLGADGTHFSLGVHVWWGRCTWFWVRIRVSREGFSSSCGVTMLEKPLPGGFLLGIFVVASVIIVCTANQDWPSNGPKRLLNFTLSRTNLIKTVRHYLIRDPYFHFWCAICAVQNWRGGNRKTTHNYCSPCLL